MSNQSIAIPEKGFLRLKQILEILPVGRTKFYAMVASGEIAKPLKLGRCSLWRKADIQETLSKIERGDFRGNPAN